MGVPFLFTRNSPVLPWIVEHATDILNKCHVTKDGRSMNDYVIFLKRFDSQSFVNVFPKDREQNNFELLKDCFNDYPFFLSFKTHVKDANTLYLVNFQFISFSLHLMKWCLFHMHKA